MVYVVIGLIVGLIAGIGIYYIIDYKNSISSKEGFKKSQSKVMKDLKEKKDAFDKEITQEQLIKQEQLRLQMEELNNSYKKAERNYQHRVQELEDDFERRKCDLIVLENQQAAARGEAQQIEIQKERDRLNGELNKLSSEYKERKEQLDNDFFIYSEQISSKKEILNKEIKIYEERQMEIIARFKEEEEKKNKIDFYRIKLTESEIEDIKKLKTIAEQLHTPTVLYKLIWENYYKSKFSELIGRIAPNKIGCGIYKITNIVNGKVYIGQTRQTFNDRLKTHVRRGLRAEPGTNNKLYNAMWEEGVENFTFEVVCQCAADELNEKERYYIDFFKSCEWGYNTQQGTR